MLPVRQGPAGGLFYVKVKMIRQRAPQGGGIGISYESGDHMRYYIGLDNGGTATKAALFDSRGKEIGSYGISTEALNRKPGFVERDMEEMWRANCTVVREVLKKTGVPAAEIAGLGISGHGKGLYLWGKDGKPCGDGIISTDNRAWRYVQQWKEDGTEEKAFSLSCQHLLSCQPVALLAWLRDNEPERYRNIQYVFACKDYIRFRLTGKAEAEITDYSGSGLMNLKTGAFDRELLKLFGIEEVWDALPPLCRATEICGAVRGGGAVRSAARYAGDRRDVRHQRLRHCRWRDGPGQTLYDRRNVVHQRVYPQRPRIRWIRADEFPLCPAGVLSD